MSHLFLSHKNFPNEYFAVHLTPTKQYAVELSETFKDDGELYGNIAIEEKGNFINHYKEGVWQTYDLDDVGFVVVTDKNTIDELYFALDFKECIKYDDDKRYYDSEHYSITKIHNNEDSFVHYNLIKKS